MHSTPSSASPKESSESLHFTRHLERRNLGPFARQKLAVELEITEHAIAIQVAAGVRREPRAILGVAALKLETVGMRHAEREVQATPGRMIPGAGRIRSELRARHAARRERRRIRKRGFLRRCLR